MKINIKYCNDCPFCITDWDPDAVGYDTFVYCQLLRALSETGRVDDFIAVYDSYKESCSQCEEEEEHECSCSSRLYTPLKDCPLRKEELTLKLENEQEERDINR